MRESLTHDTQPIAEHRDLGVEPSLLERERPDLDRCVRLIDHLDEAIQALSETPMAGFLGERLGIPLGEERFHLAEQGVAGTRARRP
jgi:hypothetical protein